MTPRALYLVPGLRPIEPLLDVLGALPRLPEELKPVLRALDFDALDPKAYGTVSGLERDRRLMSLSYIYSLSSALTLSPENCQGLLAYSSGIYAALALGGYLSPREALRGLLSSLEAASLAAPGALLGLVGLNRAQIMDLCVELESQGGFVSHHNGPRHFIVGGPRSTLEQVARRAKQQGALSANLLDGSRAYHTSHLDKCLPALTKALLDLPWQRGRHRIYGLDAPLSPSDSVERIVSLVARQMASPVLWVQKIEEAKELSGASQLIELAPTALLLRWHRRRLLERRALGTKLIPVVLGLCATPETQ